MPITVQLAARLKAAAKGRADDAPLLLQSDGSPWDKNPGQNYHRQVDKVVTAIGLDPAEVTMYALATLQHRPHAAAKCSDQAGGVAAQHRVAMIERTYTGYITEHSDDISRKALLQHEPQVGATWSRSAANQSSVNNGTGCQRWQTGVAWQFDQKRAITAWFGGDEFRSLRLHVALSISCTDRRNSVMVRPEITGRKIGPTEADAF